MKNIKAIVFDAIWVNRNNLVFDNLDYNPKKKDKQS